MGSKTSSISPPYVSGGAICEPVSTPGLYGSVFRREQSEEHWISAIRQGGDSTASILERAIQYVRDVNAEIVSMEVLGLPATVDEVYAHLDRAHGQVCWPITWVGGTSNGGGFGGVQIWAVRGQDVIPIQFKGRTVGTVFGDGCVRVCRLGGLTSLNPDLPSGGQADSVLQNMAGLLHDASMHFGNTVRTWYYNRDILPWYAEFNEVRDRFFAEQRVSEGIIPASTGIGAVPPDGNAIVGGLIAIASVDSDVQLDSAPSPLQESPVEYGSAFSRAALVSFPDHQRLLVSGTASIAPDGATMHVGNVAGQIERTMDVVEAILTASGMSWVQVTRGIAYLKNASDLPRFNEYCARTGLARLPLVVMNADICRDDLLFEIEVDALRVR